MDLASILKRYLSRGKTGQLVIKFAGEEHLCKICIENGDAVYASMGNKNPFETIDYIQGKVPEDASLLEGMPPSKRLDDRLNDKLAMIAGTEKSAYAPTHAAFAGPVAAQKIDDLIDGFIDIVGPLGATIAEKILLKIGYEKGTTMNGDDYALLFSALIDEIPEDRREYFKSTYLT